MTPERYEEIKNGILKAMAAFGINRSESYQSMSLVGLGQMLRDIPLEELIEVLVSIEGVLFENGEVRIPTLNF